MSILTFSDVHKSYRAQEVLCGATFFVASGRKVALVGANGAGKTTLLRMAAGEERPDAGRVNLLPGTRVGVLDQEPLVGDARTVLEAAQRPSGAHQQAWAELLAVEAGLEHGSDEHLEQYDLAHQRYQELHGYECETRAREVLAGLGFLASAWEKPVSVLSGGERTRLALVQLLVLQPDLLLLDEPTNHVDWEACDWLQEYLARYPGAALIVSHDRYFLDQVVQEVVALEAGETRTYAGNYSAFIRKRAAERAQEEERYQRDQQEIQRQEAIIQRLRSHRKFNSMHSREKVLEKLERSTSAPSRDGRDMKVVAGTDGRAAARVGRVALTARDLSFSYGPRSIFSALSFTLERGERLGVIGPNGAGKSTLLKVLTGELRPVKGDVSLGYQADLAYFAQDLGALDPELTVFDSLDSAAELTLAQVFQTLHQFLFAGDAVEKRVGTLSGGERTRLALACLLARRPNVLLLDEPTNHLDIPSREAVEAALGRFPGAVIVASHDRYFLERVPTRLLEIRPGIHRFFDGNYDAYRSANDERRQTTDDPARRSVVRGLSSVVPNSQRGCSPGGRSPNTVSPAKRLKQLEREIESAERRMAEITGQLADPGTYRSDAAAGLSAEYEALTATLERSYGEWGELAETAPAAKS